MHPRFIAAIAVLVLALLVTMAVLAARKVGVRSIGHPVGRVVRVGADIAVLIETGEPRMPSLKSRGDGDARFAYELWLIPETGPTRIVPVASGVRGRNRLAVTGVRRAENRIVWLATDTLLGIDAGTGARVATPVPASVSNEGMSTLNAQTDRPDEPYRLASLPAPATCKLPASLRRAAFMRSTPGGPPVTFTAPDGHLVMHSAGDAVRPTIHFSRITLDGQVVWTVDTQVVRLTQILPHAARPAFVGERSPVDQLLTVLNLADGTARTIPLSTGKP